MLAATEHWKRDDMPARHLHTYIEPVPELAATADVIRTPCGDGNMVWRSWGSGPVLQFDAPLRADPASSAAGGAAVAGRGMPTDAAGVVSKLPLLQPQQQQ